MLENKTQQNNISLDQKKDYKVENVPVFTMKKDLENNNPSYEKATISSAPAAIENNLAPQTDAKIISEKQTSSPFLSQQPQQPQKKEEIKKPVAQPIAGPSHETNWQKLILISIFIFIILVCGAGGYYYWITKQTDISETIVSQPIIQTEEEPITFSVEKPNYLPLDINNLSSIETSAALKKYIDKVSDSGALAPVEFIITDLQNNPVGFEKFASKFGITFSADLLSNLDTQNKFSLFIYNDNEKTRLGLSIDSKDDYKLKNSLTQEEPNLATGLKPIFMDVTFNEPQNKTFSSSSYANTEIRYVNMISSDELTIDYAIYQNKLVIGTTKMTLYSVMDHINNETAKPANVIENAALEE